MKIRNSALVGLGAWGIALGSLGCAGSDDAKSNDERGLAGDQTKTCRTTAGLTSESGARLLLSPALLSRLEQRAGAGDAAWNELKTQCDGYTTGTVNPPNGAQYPGYPNIGAGYQGDEYVDPMVALALCYQTAAGVDEGAAARYAATGAKVLEAISTPESAGGQRVSTNSGFGIRNFGVAMAIGYDWLYPTLGSDLRQRVIDSLNAWIDWYDANGFVRNDPIANYFVGYLHAKTFASIATMGDNPKAAGYFQDVEERMWQKLVQPEYGVNLAGGGWPEGWGYGRRAVRGVAEFFWAAQTGQGKDWIEQVPQVREQAEYISYFAWPSLTRMDDQGTVRAGVDFRPPASVMNALATILEQSGDAYAPIARSFARELVASGSDDQQPWVRFLYGDPDAPATDYKERPLSYLAPGPGHVAARSSWERDAVWGAFSAGPYINAPDSGEQMFNAGGLSVVLGGEPVLVNANGWISNTAGTAGERFVYDDAWTNHTRKLYNTFYVNDASNLYSPGQNLAGPEKSLTHVERYEDRVRYVRARGAHIEDQYGAPAGNRPVTQYNRDLVYVRPGTFVVYDRTSVAAAGADQWIAFHVPRAPSTVTPADASQRRLDVTKDATTLGSVRLLLPQNASIETAALPGGTVRIEAHAPTRGAEQSWLSVVSAGATVFEQSRLSADDANVASANMLGVHVKSTANQQVVLFPSSHDPEATVSHVEYSVDQDTAADHVLVDFAPSASGYSVTATREGGSLRITVAQGGEHRVTDAGTLSFELSQTGTVSVPKVDAQMVRSETDPSSPKPEDDGEALLPGEGDCD
jgi:hypothetical protein